MARTLRSSGVTFRRAAATRSITLSQAARKSTKKLDYMSPPIACMACATKPALAIPRMSVISIKCFSCAAETTKWNLVLVQRPARPVFSLETTFRRCREGVQSKAILTLPLPSHWTRPARHSLINRERHSLFRRDQAFAGPLCATSASEDGPGARGQRPRIHPFPPRPVPSWPATLPAT